MAIYPKSEDILIHKGAYFTGEWYYNERGEIPAFEYYERLSEVDQDRFDDLIRYLFETKPGSLLPQSLYRIEDHENKIYALKSRDQRFFNFMTINKKVVVTNAYQKHSQKMTKQDLGVLKVAVRYRNDYLSRLLGGTY